MTRAAALAALAILITARATSAQSLADVVKDASVHPTGRHRRGIEPALIERARSVVADGQGQYRIVNLRPGRNAVTFTLAGVASVVREGLDIR